MTGRELDLGLLVVPVAGGLANIAGQILLRRGLRRSLFASIIGGCLLGGVVTSVALPFELPNLSLSALDAFAIATTVFIIYGAQSVLLFAVANLGETSIRMRMLHLLSRSPEGLSVADLQEQYSDVALTKARLQQLIARGSVEAKEGRIYPRPSILLFASVVIGLWRSVLYGGQDVKRAASGSRPTGLCMDEAR